MAVVTTDAIVLRSYNLAEADRIVVCLTRSSGLIRAVAKGARRMKSRFGAALEPFTLIRLAFYETEHKELVTISEAEILKSNFDLAAQLEVADVLAYMAEMIGEFAPPHEANEKLFRMINACVEALAAAPESARIVARYFEIWLLRLAGSFPDVKNCSECGVRVPADANLYIDAEGIAKCGSCSKGRGVTLPPEIQQTIVSSEKLGPKDFAASYQAGTKTAEAQLAEFTHRLIVRALERRPRTLVAPAR